MSTDDTTIFVTTKQIGQKQQWYLTFDPKGKHSQTEKSTNQDRATFTTDAVGDRAIK